MAQIRSPNAPDNVVCFSFPGFFDTIPGPLLLVPLCDRNAVPGVVGREGVGSWEMVFIRFGAGRSGTESEFPPCVEFPGPR